MSSVSRSSRLSAALIMAAAVTLAGLPAATAAPKAPVLQSKAGLEAMFTPTTVDITGPQERLELTFTHYGRLEALVPALPALPTKRGDTVTYRHDPRLTAWYTTTPKGIEHGYDLTQPPPGGGDLVFTLQAHTTLTPAGVEDDEILFLDGPFPRIRYSDLHAYDHTGVELPTRITLEGDTIRLHIDDQGAHYPVTIDPHITLVGGSLAASDASWTGEGEFDEAGISVAGAGDVNGDGYHDILVGARRNDAAGINTGAAYLILGGPTGWANGTTLSHPSIIRYTGEAVGDLAGHSVAAAGDVNGDGYADILVGAPTTIDHAGVAYLILGSPTPTSGSLGGHIRYTGEAAGDLAGHSVAAAGDVNGDGYADILVGAHHNDAAASNAGAAYLILGSPTPTPGSLSSHIRYTGEAVNDSAGFSGLAGAGDVNGDGYADILVGADFNDAAGNNAGAAYLILGSPTPTPGSLGSHIRYTGQAAGDVAGRSVAGAGDVNGDGYADIIVGAPHNDAAALNAGAAYLILGSPTPTPGSLSSHIRYTGQAAGDSAGHSVAGAGDVNGDGHHDILVGAFGNDAAADAAGAAYLILGSPTPGAGAKDTTLGHPAIIRYTGEAVSDLAGYSVAGAGDVNGDGLADLLVGAYRNDDAADDAGAAYLLLGGPSSHPSYTHRQRLRGNAGDALPAHFPQARVTVDITAGALPGGEIKVTRHLKDPCTNNTPARPIWTIDTNKVNPVAGTDVLLQFTYTDNQVRGLDESKLRVLHLPPDDPCGEPTPLGPAVVNTAFNRIDLHLTGVTELGQFTIGQHPHLAAQVADFNGDGTSDLSFYRPSTGRWHIADQPSIKFGTDTDIPVPGDYNGDGRTDLAIYRTSTNRWIARDAVTGQSLFNRPFGQPGDIPVPGDYNGDGRTDLAIYRSGRWIAVDAATGTTILDLNLGGANDVPIPTDFNNDGTTDIATYRPSTRRWTARDPHTNTEILNQVFGATGDIPLPGDYNGDGKVDLGIFRPSDRRWQVRDIETGPGSLLYSQQFGLETDIPVPANYDGNPQTEFAIYRPSEGRWHVKKPGEAGLIINRKFGSGADIPLPLPYAVWNKFFGP